MNQGQANNQLAFNAARAVQQGQMSEQQAVQDMLYQQQRLAQQAQMAQQKLDAQKEAREMGFANDVYLAKLRKAKTPEEVSLLKAQARRANAAAFRDESKQLTDAGDISPAEAARLRISQSKESRAKIKAITGAKYLDEAKALADAENANPDSDTFFMVSETDPWFGSPDIDKVEAIRLPKVNNKQVTMQDVEDTMKAYGLPKDQVVMMLVKKYGSNKKE